MTTQDNGWLRASLVGAIALFLVACGGADPADASVNGLQTRSLPDNHAHSDTDGSSAAGGNVKPDAQLTAETLALAETQALEADASKPLDSLLPGSIAAKAAYASGAIVQKAAGVSIPAYRFYNAQTGAHFYTVSASERDSLLSSYSSPFTIEGAAFEVAGAFSSGLSPVHRFLNARTGVHFYTISETERANAVAALPQLVYEGVAYYASQVAGAGLVPFYRFYARDKGFHFYTASESERANLQNNLSSSYSYEGIGYYVMASDSQVSTSTTWVKAVDENQTYTLSGLTEVRYGAGTSWIQRSLSGTFSCTNDFFGSDPAPGSVKSCQVSAGVVSTPAPSTPVTPVTPVTPTPASPTTNSGILAPGVGVEYVDAQGVRQSVRVVSGQTTVSGVAPFLVKFDASVTRAPAAFSAQSAITDPEAYAFLMTGYRLNYGENRGGVWQYPQGSSHSRDEDTGPPVFSYVYQTAGSYPVRLRTRDALGNEADVQFNVVVNAAPTPVLIRPTDGRWPTFVSGTRYSLQANGDYRSFGALETGGRHNIVIEKVGSGADPMISTFSPDGRSKFTATQQLEYRASHIRLVNVDIAHFTVGQRGFDYVGVIGGLVRRFSDSGQNALWHEGTDLIRSNVRYSRGLFFQDTEMRSTASESGYIMIGNFNGLHARNTRFVHAENGSTTYAMLRVYGSNFTFRNNLWHSQVDGGSGNGTLISMLAITGQTPVAWRDDDTVGPVSGTSNSQAYGYISEKQILQNNQMYSSGSFLTNGVSSVGGGNPEGTRRVYPRLIGWEDNVFTPTGNIARTIQNGELYGQYNFWRNNRKGGGQGAYVSATSSAPNRTIGDQTTFNGPVLNESANSRPSPSSF